MSILIPRAKIYFVGPEVELPAVVDNAELLRRFGYADGIQTRLKWIEARAGIKRRHWANESQACSDLAIAAARKLLARHESRVGGMILSTVSGDYVSPPTSPLVQAGLGLKDICAYDLSAACAGFATGLLPAISQALVTGADQLLICSEIRSKFLNPKDLSTAILFGDGAAAMVVSPQATGARFLIRGVIAESHGEYHDLIKILQGGSRCPRAGEGEDDQSHIKMANGPSVFLSALAAMTGSGKKLVAAAGLAMSDVKWLVPHQANGLLIAEVGKQLNFKSENIVSTIEETGNVSGASSAIALNALLARHPIKGGELVLNVSAGGGGFLAGVLLEVL